MVPEVSRIEIRPKSVSLDQKYKPQLFPLFLFKNPHFFSQKETKQKKTRVDWIANRCRKFHTWSLHLLQISMLDFWHNFITNILFHPLLPLPKKSNNKWKLLYQKNSMIYHKDLCLVGVDTTAGSSDSNEIRISLLSIKHLMSHLFEQGVFWHSGNYIV